MGPAPLTAPLLLAGYFGHGNVGDEWILARLRGAFGPGTEYLSGPRPRFPGAIPRGNLLAVGSALRRARGLVLGGGELFQTRTSRRSLAYYLALPALLSVQRKPFWIIGVGVDPDLPSWALEATAAVARRARTVWVRDDESKALLYRHGVSSVRFPDLAWAMGPRDRTKAPGQRRVLWIPRFPDGARSVRRFTSLFHAHREVHHAVWGLHPAEDERWIAEGRREWPDNVEAGVIDVPDDLFGRIAAADLVVSMRYHGVVAAGLAGRPVLALGGYGKVRLLAESMGVPLWDPAVSNKDVLLRAMERTPFDSRPWEESARTALSSLRDIIGCDKTDSPAKL